MADYNYVLGYMKYAYDNGWIPVVDMQNYQTLYNEDHPIHGDQCVEYFFEQPIDPATASATRWKKYTRAKRHPLTSSDQRCNFTGDKDPEVLKWQHEMAERRRSMRKCRRMPTR